ncbi:putative pentatricopeptide repeat-containing protein At3g18840 [Bidens hawaiensis]|uniref:putative pentatricopeptide repeat-containing protein At3g18840 n=1 Tax=Bidens hawaiensis TaxID=980011 RepID=UPI004049BCE3
MSKPITMSLLLIDTLKSHCHTIKSGNNYTIYTSNHLIHLYSKHGLIKHAHQLFDEMPDRNVFTWNAIISAYIKSNNLNQSQILFNATPFKDSVTYNTMLSGYANTEGYETNAVRLFKQMHIMNCEARVALVDEFSLTRMCNLTAKLKDSLYGKQLHSFMVKTGNDVSTFAVSALVDMYSKTGCFNEACGVFNGCGYTSVDAVSKNTLVAACCREGKLDMGMNIFLSRPELNDAVSWNTMITGYAQNGFEGNAVELARCMVENGFEWNEHTFTSVLNACSSLKCLILGKEVHARILKQMINLKSNPFASSGIVDVYCKCGNMKYAESVYSQTGSENMFSATSLIMGYCSQQNMLHARRVFDSLKSKNSVVWSAMFSGYLNCNCCENVFELFHIFKHQELKELETNLVDDSIWSTLLGACAMQAIIDPGKQTHGYILKTEIINNVKVISSLIDMYSKCGNVVYAERIFKRVNVKDSVIYNVMISGFAHHGYVEHAFKVIDNMVKDGFTPDGVTFIAVLSACRHSGMVKTGEYYFKLMTETYNIEPGIDHYACMIDLYGRANELKQAMEFMKKIQIELDVVILGTFLSACKLHGNAELARVVEDEMLRIGGESGTRYVQLANVYASEGRWGDMGRIRKKMRGNEVGKVAGCSWVHVGSQVHSFTSGDSCRAENEALCDALRFLVMEMKVKEEIIQLCF